MSNNHNARLLLDGEGGDERHGYSRYGVNSRVMLTAVLALFFVVVLVLAVHLYARWVLRRRARRRRAMILQLSMGVAAAETHTVPQQPKKGLDPSIIAALPEFVYKKTNDLGLECSICLSGLEEGEMARVLPNCNHTFHEQCIGMWLNSNSTCPVCRTEAEPKPREEKVEASAPPLMEGTSEVVGQSSKVGASSSRLSSFRRMLSRERSESRTPCSVQDDGVEDLERQ